LAPPGGELHALSVLFVDIRGYTALAEKTNPHAVAARLESEALSGEILISQATYDRVADDFPHATRRELLLKGKSERVIAWQIAATIATADS
jgi:class 3 adenylate cyclase